LGRGPSASPAGGAPRPDQRDAALCRAGAPALDPRQRDVHRFLLQLPLDGELPRYRRRDPLRTASRERRVVTLPGAASARRRPDPGREAGRADPRERRDLLRTRGEPRGRHELPGAPARLRPRRRGDGRARAAARLAPPLDAPSPRVRPRYRRVDRRHRALCGPLRPELAAAGLVRRPRSPAGRPRARVSAEPLLHRQRRIRHRDLRTRDRRDGQWRSLVSLLPDQRAAPRRVGRDHLGERDPAPGDACGTHRPARGRALLRSDLPVVSGPELRARARRRRRKRDGNGVFVLYNYYRQPWLLAKIEGMLADVFGTEPLVREYDAPIGSAAVLAASPGDLQVSGQAALLSPAIPTDRPAAATDDWPFLYLRDRVIAPYYILALIFVVLVGGVATVLAARVVSAPLAAFSPHFFLLGAAFLLLETRSLTMFSLLFGTTWTVNAMAFAAILTSVLLAIGVNAMTKPPRAVLYSGL